MDNNTPMLYEVLKNSYAKNKSPQMGGFEYDQQLSTHNHQVYYDKEKKQLLFSVTGSHNASDWLNNLKLGLGIGFKQSNRYKDSHKALRDAKAKYNVQNATVVGHSQGGYTAQHISSAGDKVLTLDKAATIGGKLKSGDHYRTAGDIVSTFEVGKKHTHTLENKKGGSLLGTAFKTGASLATGNLLPAISATKDVLQSHDVENIKNENIFV